MHTFMRFSRNAAGFCCEVGGQAEPASGWAYYLLIHLLMVFIFIQHLSLYLWEYCFIMKLAAA